MRLIYDRVARNAGNHGKPQRVVLEDLIATRELQLVKRFNLTVA